MTGSYQNMFRIPELKRRLLFTAMILIVYRLGGHITTPGVDLDAIKQFFEGQKGTLVALYDMFAGGNLRQATIFALGIMPYISASIILQLLQAVIPYFEKLAKEGEEGRKKIQQYTRWGTLGLAFVQSFGVSFTLERLGVVQHPGIGFKLVTMLTLTTGTMFVMWLGEQITERGIGNGISLIIFIGIIARYPADILNTFQALRDGTLHWLTGVIVGVLMIGVIAGIIAITQGQRRIPVQYAKKIVGRRVYGGANTHIPLRVNTAGVIPIIFAQSIIMFPGTLGSFFGDNAFIDTLTRMFQPPHIVYIVAYSSLIILFTYFYTAVILNPVDLADNMKKNSGFIPGVRPGKKTAEYIDRVLTRVTLPGAFFLAAIAIMPDLMIYYFNVPFQFGGTGLLIVIGVGLDTLQQIESHLVMRHYDGFMTKGRLRARR
ncbi:preprotein translocase subunit SecY [bacterium]|nr:preprotein translocase subunit SecY [bacterium]MBU1675282.1 preprotein translocase subunit SecY [bacterium]